MNSTSRLLNPIVALGMLLASALMAGCRPSVDTSDAADVRLGATSAAGTPVTTAASAFTVYDLPSRWQDQHGDTLSLGRLAGRVRVVAMVYTECRVTCPLIVQALKRIEAGIPAAQHDSVGFVLVSLDPERDTPGRLASWARSTGLAAGWTLLAGDDDAVRELAATLEVRYQSQPDGEIAHTNGITVLDRTGAVSHRQLALGETEGTLRAVRALLR